MATDFGDLDKAWSGATPAAPGANFSEPMAEGTKLKVAVVDQEFALIGGKATPDCKVTFEVMESVNPDHIGRKVWHDFWLTSGNAPYLKRDLGTLGWKGTLISQLANPSDASLMCLGADVTLGIEEYTDKNGIAKRKNVIKFFNENYIYKPKAAATDSAGGGAAAIPEEEYPF
jgi:hypothetical protein